MALEQQELLIREQRQVIRTLGRAGRLVRRDLVEELREERAALSKPVALRSFLVVIEALNELTQMSLIARTMRSTGEVTKVAAERVLDQGQMGASFDLLFHDSSAVR